MIFALQHQAITWTNVDESPARSGGIHQWAISQDTYPSLSYIILSYSILSYPMVFKFIILKLQPNLPGANDLYDNVTIWPA